jgi:hypothetical protein
MYTLYSDSPLAVSFGTEDSNFQTQPNFCFFLIQILNLCIIVILKGHLTVKCTVNNQHLLLLMFSFEDNAITHF